MTRSVRISIVVVVAIVVIGGSTSSADVAKKSADVAKKCPSHSKGNTVEIVSEPPGATIYIGDTGCESVGTTPWSGKLPTGTHHVRLEAKSFESTENVLHVVKRTRPQRLSIKLVEVVDEETEEVDPPTIAVTAGKDPRLVGATVRVDGETKGQVPVTVTTTEGRHRIEISKRGFRTYALHLQATGEVELEPSLEAIAAPDRRPRRSPSRVFASFGLAVPVYVYAQPIAGAKGVSITPDQNLSVGQAVAVGVIASPRLSIVGAGQFLETVQTDKGQTGWAFGSVTLFGSLRLWRGLSVGAGPLFQYRALNQTAYDYGAYFTLGYRTALPDQFSLTVGVNSLQSWVNTLAVVVAPGVAISRRL